MLRNTTKNVVTFKYDGNIFSIEPEGTFEVRQFHEVTDDHSAHALEQQIISKTGGAIVAEASKPAAKPAAPKQEAAQSQAPPPAAPERPAKKSRRRKI